MPWPAESARAMRSSLRNGRNCPPPLPIAKTRQAVARLNDDLAANKLAGPGQGVARPGGAAHPQEQRPEPRHGGLGRRVLVAAGDLRSGGRTGGGFRHRPRHQPLHRESLRADPRRQRPAGGGHRPGRYCPRPGHRTPRRDLAEHGGPRGNGRGPLATDASTRSSARSRCRPWASLPPGWPTSCATP